MNVGDTMDADADGELSPKEQAGIKKLLLQHEL